METWSLSERQERVLTRSVGRTKGRNCDGPDKCLRTYLHISMHSAGKADWTMLGGNMVGFAPSFMDNLRERVSTWGMELALTGVDFYVFVTPPCAWTQLQPTPETMSEQPVKMCCIAHSCFPYLHHQDHCSDDCPNDVTPMWVECNVDMMFPSPNMSSSSVSAISTNSRVCVSVCKVATPNVQLC